MILAIIAAATIDLSAASAPLNAEVLATELRTRGSVFVDRELDRNGSWNRLMLFIATGQPQWVALVGPLSLVADGSHAEDLNIALGAALPRQPQLILALINAPDHRLSIDEVCSIPFSSPGKLAVERYAARTLRALRAVTNPRLAKAKAACINRLAQALSEQRALHYPT